MIVLTGKTCTLCKVFKTYDFFGKRKEGLDGRRSRCIECITICRRDYYKAHHVKNKEQKLKYAREYYSTEHGKKIQRKNLNIYKKTHLAERNTYGANRRAKKVNATPTWPTDFDIAYIKHIYIQSIELSKISEESYEVDLITPLMSKQVCGLHVPWNLQIITATENQKKSNKVL